MILSGHAHNDRRPTTDDDTATVLMILPAALTFGKGRSDDKVDPLYQGDPVWSVIRARGTVPWGGGRNQGGIRRPTIFPGLTDCSWALWHDCHDHTQSRGTTLPMAGPPPSGGSRRARDSRREGSDPLPDTGSDSDSVAVALGYDPGSGRAPTVLASGRGGIAEQILALAFANGVKVREDADLVQILATVDVESEIPLEALAAVAEILSYVYRANSRLASGEAPSDRGAEVFHKSLWAALDGDRDPQGPDARDGKGS